MGINADIRRERFCTLTSLPRGRALEIGPLGEPILLRDEHDVTYVDVFDQGTLQDHYRDDPNVDCDAIPVIDFTLSTPDGFVGLAQAVRDGTPFSYVVACHVIEHVPDAIGWLEDIAEVLDDGGLLLLVVPDRRYCFDHYRHQTSVGQMLQAAGTQDKAPSIRAVYDHLRDASTVSAADIWQGIPPEQLGSVRIHDIDYVLTQMKRADEGEYVDSHVWTFTPESFVEQVHELGLLGRCDFEFEAMQPTQENSLEFYAVLRRLPRAVSPSARLARISESVQIALEAARSGPVPRGVDVAELQEQLREATAAAESLRQELAAVKSSERWRIGGLLVSPPRWALQQVRQRVHSP